MNERTQVLAGILADTDAVFVPNRNWQGNRSVVLYERRRDYPAGGVPWHSDALDNAGAKAMQRLLESLAAEGRVKTFRPRRIKTLGVKLTERGEAQARALCGLPSLDDSVRVGVLGVKRYQNSPQAGVDRGVIWIPETILAGVEWGQNDKESRSRFVWVENVMLPALVRGWIVSNSSGQGHVWYSLTPSGLAMLDNPPKAPARSASFNKEANAYYFERLKERLVQWDSMTPNDTREIGDIPLPVTMDRRGSLPAENSPPLGHRYFPKG